MKSILNQIANKAPNESDLSQKFGTEEVNSAVKITFESIYVDIGFDAAALFVNHCFLAEPWAEKNAPDIHDSGQGTIRYEAGKSDGVSHDCRHKTTDDAQNLNGNGRTKQSSKQRNSGNKADAVPIPTEDYGSNWRLFWEIDLLVSRNGQQNQEGGVESSPDENNVGTDVTQGQLRGHRSPSIFAQATESKSLSIPAANLLDSPAMYYAPEGCQSALTVPLRKDGMTLGQVVLYKKEPHYFDSERIHKLESYRAMLTMILQSSEQTLGVDATSDQQVVRTVDPASESQALAIISAELKKAQTPDQLGEIFLREIVTLTDGLGSTIYKVDPAAETLDYWQGYPSANIDAPSLDLNKGLIGTVASGNEPIIYHWAAEDYNAQPTPEEAKELGIQYGAVLLPMSTSQEQLVGILLVHLDENQVLDPETIPVLQSIATMAADVLNRASTMKTLEQLVAERTQELRSVNKRLLDLDKLKNKFIEDISHEFRTPLTSIGLYLSLLEKEAPETSKRHIDALKRQTDQLSHLVNGILDVSNPERVSGLGECDQVNIANVIQELVITKRPYAEANGLTLKFGEFKPAYVYGNLDSLHRAISNLLDNAINYTPQGSIRVKLIVDATPPQEEQLEETAATDNSVSEKNQSETNQSRRPHLCIRIEDTGLGIPENDLEYIFDRFYRGTQVSQLSIPGTGLGLSIVRQIVEQHGGRIEVESKLGKGTIFQVWLPILEAVQEAEIGSGNEYSVPEPISLLKAEMQATEAD